MIRIDYVSNGAMRTEIVADYEEARKFMREHSKVISFTTREVRKLTDGIIKLGTDRANSLGFTSDLFDGYLWKIGDEIMISLITSKQEGKGNLRALFDRIEAAGYRIAVPTPSNRMRAICEKRGMITEMDDDPDLGPVEVMRKPRNTHVEPWLRPIVNALANPPKVRGT